MATDRSIRKSNQVRGFISTTLGTLAIVGSQFAAPALAQQQQTGPQPPAAPAATPAPVEEVTVTGTRIKRADLESQSPLVTVDAEALQSRAGLNIESYLNQLPSYNPATTPTNGGQLDVQANAVNTLGISTISLRGFGPNRSLVLVDGHRTTPVNALMVTDINSIPVSMIDRVEIISGGASAVYGADAIGGVTNFILKKNFQGLQFDVQDSITQAGDGNELMASALMGTKIGDGRGNLIMGMEYYDRSAAYQRNRDFYTNGWNDPTTAGSDFFYFGANGYSAGLAAPTAAATQAVLPGFAGFPNGAYGPFGGNRTTFYFGPGGNPFSLNGPITAGGYNGPTNGDGYALHNVYDSTQLNCTFCGPAPSATQQLKWNYQGALASEPQTRYSFFANGKFDITDKVQFYANARFAQSRTQTVLFPANASFGWEADVPYNQATDDPLKSGSVVGCAPTDPAACTALPQLQQVAAAFKQYGYTAQNPYYNSGYIATGKPGAQHPVPWQLAMLIDSRPPLGSQGPGTSGTAYGGPVSCNPSVGYYVGGALQPCAGGASSWIAETYPNSFGPRATTDTSTEFTIETGLRFPIAADWTGDLYYSRGQTTDYNLAYGDNSLQRWRAMITAPDYGRGVTVYGNQDGASPNFGTSVPATCTSGFYDTLFGGDAVPSQNCVNAVEALLQTQTQIQQDIVEANFQGSLFKLPAGDISAAVGYQWRRDSAQFYPDGLQSANSFTDQVIGVYPTGSLDAQTSVRDAYAEFFIPVVKNFGVLKALNLDVGGRYSSYSIGENTSTFKVNMDAGITNSMRIRGGFNRASRAPNLGELFLNEQEFFGGGAVFGDPCSLQSKSPFGAGASKLAETELGTPDPSPGAAPPVLAGGQTEAGANSTYLICKAQMGLAASQYYSPTQSQAGFAAAAPFAWVNQEGNANLRSETANTWTGGVVFSNLGDSPWLRGFTASVDWWRVDIYNAIELDSSDYANYLCYGTNTVSTPEQAAAQAASAACQNVPRNLAGGTVATSLLQYTNLGRISTSGVDLDINWMVGLRDIGIPVPGSFMISSQDSWLNFYRTKQSPLPFDVETDWKGSLGPLLAGTNPGAYSYRLFTSFGYVLPSFSVNLRWRFLPSVNSATHASTAAIEANNAKVAGGAPGVLLSYQPDLSLAAPHYNAFDMSFSWNINSVLQLRGGINNLLDKLPVITGATAGYAGGDLCHGKPGCSNPAAYSLPSDGAGTTNAGFYDVYGRTFFLGVRAQF